MAVAADLRRAALALDSTKFAVAVVSTPSLSMTVTSIRGCSSAPAARWIRTFEKPSERSLRQMATRSESEAPALEATSGSRKRQLLVLSAKTATAQFRSLARSDNGIRSH